MTHAQRKAVGICLAVWMIVWVWVFVAGSVAVVVGLVRDQSHTTDIGLGLAIFGLLQTAAAIVLASLIGREDLAEE